MTDGDKEGASQKLREYIAAIKLRESTRGADLQSGRGTTAADSCTGERAKLGQGPPCGSYEDLMTMGQFDDKLEGFMIANTRQELTDIAEDLKKHKKAIAELVGATAGVARELSAGVVAAKRKIKQEKDMVEKKKTATPKPGSTH
eukprot:5770300-Pyramimonas_sp.AAC.1